MFFAQANVTIWLYTQPTDGSMSRVLDVSSSGFYDWRRRQDRPSARQQHQEQIDEAVKVAFETRKGRYGAPRLAHDMAKEGAPPNRKTIAASQQRQGLRAKAAKKFKAKTNSNHDLPVAPNLLQQDFLADAPNEKRLYHAPLDG